MASNGTPSVAGVRLFAGLGRAIWRHPWYPILFWVLLLVVTLPFLSYLGSVQTQSATNLPPNTPSSQAQAELARLFPSTAAGGTSSILLFVGPNMTSAASQAALENVTRALLTDRALSYVASIESVYTAYAGYLAGQAQLAGGVIVQGLASTPSVLAGVNDSAALLWGPSAAFLQTWATLSENATRTPAEWAPVAYNDTATSLAGDPPALAVLSAFYNGYPITGSGFNGTAGCVDLSPPTATPCADQANRANVGPLIPSIVPGTANQTVPRLVLATLGIENFTAWPNVRASAASALAASSGLSGAWIDTVWADFPGGAVSPSAAATWANATVAATTLATGPLPVPTGLRANYVNGAGTASLITVTFSVGSSYMNSSGGTPVTSDLNEIARVVPPALAASDPTRTITFYQTGPAALDADESSVLDRSIALVLPLTVSALVVITMLYFRAPLAPLITFTGLGIAIALGLGGVVLIGTLVTHVDPTALTLEDTFVLGVGTDYSIFLVARYREELHSGATPEAALVTSVTWAGQSIATSGSTAIIATLALAFSGVALLSQWGLVLSLAILITVLVALTLIPALLRLVGPRVFWPHTGDRFLQQAERVRERVREEKTYFYRVGRLSQRRPRAIISLILLVSIPLLLVFLSVPISFDFYQQLPSGSSATDGLTALGQQFGDGFAFPTTALVTFASPLLVGNATNATEFQELGAMTGLAESTPGIALVQGLVGPYGAPLGAWLNYSVTPPAAQANLQGLLNSYVGVDGRTTLLVVQTNASGLSADAISAIGSVSSRLSSYASEHPAVTGLAYGGGGPVTRDLADQTLLATERMVLLVSIGLIIVLLFVLRSWILPLMAVATIGLSIVWAWALTYLVLGVGFGLPLFYFVPTLMFILILGLGIDYNIFLLTRVREERLRGRTSSDAAVEAVGRTGGIITAAAVILASAFALLAVGDFTLLRAIGFAVALAVLLDAMVVRTFFVPAALQAAGDRVWSTFKRRPTPPTAGPGSP